MPWTRGTKLILAGVILAIGLPGLAAGASWREGWGSGRHARHGDWCATRADSRLGEGMILIERRLILTPEQQGAWARLADAVARSAREVQAICATSAAGNAPAELARLEAGIEAGLAAVRGLRPPLDAFYAVLAPDQRARLDDLLRGRL